MAQTKGLELDNEEKQAALDLAKTFGYSGNDVSEGVKEANKKAGERYVTDLENISKTKGTITRLEGILENIDKDQIDFRTFSTFADNFIYGDAITNYFNPKLADVRDRIRGIAFSI
jgi:hypothetical protein